MTKQDLVDAVLDDTVDSIKRGDLTVLEELLNLVPVEYLIKSLGEEAWEKFNHLIKK